MEHSVIEDYVEKRAAIKKNAYSNRAAVQGTNYLQKSEAYDDMIGMNTDTMANEVSFLFSLRR